MTATGKLTVGSDGRVRGDASIEYNSPFPCVNGRMGVTGRMNGVLQHTMVGNLPGTIAEFNNPHAQASAHFGIDQDGRIHQFGPIGKGWEAWHAVAANLTWYGIEHADNGNPDNPLTDAQLTASAQLVECLSAFAGFPLQVTDSTTGRGYGTHSMGGAAWGGHTCPDLPPRHVRSAQRGEIIRRAKAIRNPAPPAPHLAEHVTVGQMSLAQLARQHYPELDLAAAVERILANTAGHATPAQLAAVLEHVARVVAGEIAVTVPMPEGLHVWVRQA